MASPADSDDALLIPPDAPQSKFVRYARAVSSDYAPLFPMTPATRPMVIGVDLRTLGPDPSAHEELVDLLRRDEVSTKLLQYADGDTGLGEAWMQAAEEVDLHVPGSPNYPFRERVTAPSRIHAGVFCRAEDTAVVAVARAAATAARTPSTTNIAA